MWPYRTGVIDALAKMLSRSQDLEVTALSDW